MDVNLKNRFRSMKKEFSSRRDGLRYLIYDQANLLNERVIVPPAVLLCPEKTGLRFTPQNDKDLILIEMVTLTAAGGTAKKAPLIRVVKLTLS
jgi:hypothetical protein